LVSREGEVGQDRRSWPLQARRIKGSGFRPRSSAIASGSTTDSRWASARSRSWCWSAAWSSPTRRSGSGVPSSGRNTALSSL